MRQKTGARDKTPGGANISRIGDISMIVCVQIRFSHHGDRRTAQGYEDGDTAFQLEPTLHPDSRFVSSQRLLAGKRDKT